MFDRARRSPGRSLWYFLGPWGLGRSATTLYCRISFHMRMFGRENIPRTGPVLYVCNHQSFLDLMACGGMCADRPFTPMARKSLWCNRVMTWYLDQYFAIPVDQDGGAGTAAVKSALRELAEGRCVLIYPEGSRSDDGLMLPFERGLMVMIKRGNAPVVPLAIDGAYECWARTVSKPRLSGHLSIIAGAPIMPEDLLRDGADAGLEMLRRRIETLRLEVRARVRARWGPNAIAPGPSDLPYWEREGAGEAATSPERRESEKLQAGNHE